jgi:hypothetical protein
MRAMLQAVKRTAQALAWLTVVWLVAGCAGDKDGTAADTAVTTHRSSGDPLLERYAGNFDYRKSTDGAQRVMSGQRSSFEGKEAAGYGKNVDKKEFGTKAYTKKPWWGTKEYTTSDYAGPTDGSRFQKRSWFAGKKAREATKVFPAAGKNYPTNDYPTSEAQEASTSPLDKPTDALVESRRATYQPPAVMDWRQARKMKVDETRSILGRE